MILDIVSKSSKFAFYGAQVVAYGAYTAVKHLLNREPECFIVSKFDGNPGSIDGISVRTLDAVPVDTLIIIAVTELLQDEIAATLQAKGYLHTFQISAHQEHLLMSQYYGSLGRFPLAVKTARSTADFTLYEVRHHLDKPLRNHPKLERWEVSIQAGAGLADVRICEQLDSGGENISIKNRQYCEASAMYWVWKNAKTSWVGIEHYRRHLLVTPDMLNQDVDAILPLPYLCYPNSQAQFRRFVGEEVVQALSDALKTLYPNEYDEYYRCLRGNYHYAYNLIAAKSSVFADYCEWAFRITDYMETLGIQGIKETRSLAYTIEMLTSIYFIYNQDKLKIRHAEKAIYI